MGRLRSAFAAFAPDAAGPGELLSSLDRFAAGPGGVDFATACYAILDSEARRLTYASAAHPPILVVDPSGRAHWLQGGRSGPLYGALDDERIEATVALEPGSLVLLYSDGLVERRGELITTGFARLETTAIRLRDLPVEAICDGLIETLGSGAELRDDIVVVGIRTLPVAEDRFHRVFPARPEELRHVRAASRHWLAERGVSRLVTQDLVLVLGEACANAVEHAYDGGEPGEVEVEIVDEKAELVLTVRDFGRWRPSPENGQEDRGLGSTIIEALSDSVSFARGREGTTVTMRIGARSGPPA
jgi:anti-sigma regulatory factor (Ser/Thr protein kinase)